MRRTIVSRAAHVAAIAGAIATAIAARSAGAQDHAHAAGAERLGTVHFATSCRAEVAPRFDRAVALLHSFEFGAAIRGFRDVLATDSTCAMAHWGIALSRWGNPMAAGNRAPSLLADGRRTVEAAARLAPNASERERAYVAAVGTLFDDYERKDQPTRVAAYERAMADVASRNPADTEALIFHALALAATAPATDKTYAKQREAGATLEALWKKQPDHPGLAHYVIHSYDVPALAPQAVTAARRYSEIAPQVAHALHMPSHTFTRLGLWSQSATSNLRSIDAARRDSSLGEVLHASDYLMYAYMQTRQEANARALLDALPSIVARYDPNAIGGAAPGSAGIFAIAAMPARHALERDAWEEAAALSPKASAYPWTEAMTHFARALGAARLKRPADARADVDSLGAIGTRLTARAEPYWTEQVAIQRLAAEAWLRLAEGNQTDALARMREAATREDATDKNVVTPGPLAPARELLGDMLLSLGRPAEALAEYRATLAREPNRYRALRGAMTAARATGDRAAASRYEKEIGALTAR